MRAKRFYSMLALVFIGACIVRLALIYFRYTDTLNHFQSGDYLLYKIGATHFLQERNFSNSLFMVRPPLFPLLIAALDMDGVAVLVANTLIGAAIAPLTVILARQLGLAQGYAVLAGIIVALDPASVVYASWLGPEALANITLLIMICALLQGVVYTTGFRSILWTAVAGLALTLSTLARPAAYLLWIGLSIWLLLAYRRQWAAVAVYALVSIVGIGAWIGHNAVVFDNPAVSSIGAYNMLYYRAASVEHWASGDDMSTVYIRLARRVEERMGHDTANITNNTRHKHYTGDAELTNAVMSVAMDTYTAHPLTYLMLIPFGLARMFLFSDPLPKIEVLWNSTFLLLTAAGLWFAARHHRNLLLWSTLLIAGYFIVGTLVAQTSGMDTRMRTGFTPLMAVSTAYALYALRQQRVNRPLWPLAVDESDKSGPLAAIRTTTPAR